MPRMMRPLLQQCRTWGTLLAWGVVALALTLIAPTAVAGISTVNIGPRGESPELTEALRDQKNLARCGSINCSPSTASAQRRIDPRCPGVVFPSIEDYRAYGIANAECDRAKGITNDRGVGTRYGDENASRRDALLPWLLGGLIVAVAIPGIAYARRSTRDGS